MDNNNLTRIGIKINIDDEFRISKLEAPLMVVVEYEGNISKKIIKKQLNKALKKATKLIVNKLYEGNNAK